jgi:hypothetical protein
MTSYSAAISASTLATSADFAFGQSGCDAIELGSGWGCGAGVAVCAPAAPQHNKAATAAEHTEITRTRHLRKIHRRIPETIRRACVLAYSKCIHRFFTAS